MITLADIRHAASLLESSVLHTPLLYSPAFSKLSGTNVYLKLENLQKTGSFKIRGAAYKIRARYDSIGEKGVVAASAGNHAQGVALAARDAGLPATIVMPECVSLAKQEATLGYGAEVVLHSQSVVECIEAAECLAASGGRMFIHPFDDYDIIAGQGTVGLEIIEDLKNPDYLFVPVGGGGLIAGVATAAKALCPDVHIVGVQAAVCPSAAVSCREGRRTCVDAARSIADGITVREPGEKTFPIIRDLVDTVTLVTEDQIASAMVHLLESGKVLAEGAGASPLAALLAGSVPVPEGSNVVLVVSGGNVDPLLIDRVLRQGFLWSGRIMRFTVWLDDEPGSLARLLGLLTRMHANVLDIHHARHERGMPISVSRVKIELETRDHHHIEEIREELCRAGYLVAMQ
jgi:threonine dehydratase